MADMEVDPPETSNDKGKKDSGKKRFEVKKVRKLSARLGANARESLNSRSLHSGTPLPYGLGVREKMK